MFEEIREILSKVLQLGDGKLNLTYDTALLGNIAEFDSMAVVSVITMIEENYGISIEDDEISAETFETLGSLVQFVEEKL